MKHLKAIDHIGYAVHDIVATARYYVAAGWQLSEIYEERVQNARIAFLYKEGASLYDIFYHTYKS